MDTLIYFIRHGQSLGNLSQIMLGHTDLDLSPLGYLQAEKTCEELSGVHFDAIYSSDLIRAYNTAKPHAELRGMNIITSQKLREMNVGEWENMHVQDIIDKYGELFTIGWRKNFGEVVVPGGESADEARERFYSAVLEIAKKHPGETILITAHAAVIRLLWGKINNVPPAELAETYPYPTNASYSIARWNGKELIPESYSNDSHLASMSSNFVP